MIKILHTGDLHLGSAFAALAPEERAERRRAELDAFHTMLSAVRERSCDLLLVAGDLFDVECPHPDLSDEVWDAFAALPCPVVIAPGNHDPYTPRSPYASGALPPNVSVFSEEHLTRIRPSGLPVDVFGFAFCGSTVSESPLASAPDNACIGDGLSILLCHGDVDQPLSRYAPMRTADLRRSGADYAALGHVHNVSGTLSGTGETRAAYCGFLTGRSFDECGFGGYLIVTLDENATVTHPVVSVERVTVETSRYLSERLSVVGAASDSDAVRAIRALLAERRIGKETVLRLTLDGEVALRYAPDLHAIRAAFSGESDPLLLLTDDTLPIYDAAYLENDPTLTGEFYRALLPTLKNGTEEERRDAASALRLGFAALHGRPIL